MDDTAFPTPAPPPVESVIRRLSLLPSGELSHDPEVAPLLPGFHFDTRLIAGITPIDRDGPLDFGILRPDGMRGWIINLTIKGEGRIYDGTDHFSVGPGDLTLFPPGVTHDYGRAPESDTWWHRWIYFQPRAYWTSWLSWRVTRGGLHTQHGLDPSLLQTMDQLFADVASGSASNDLLSIELAMNLLERIILLAAKNDRTVTRPGHFDQRLLMACKFITDNLHRPLSVSEIAEAVCLSPSRLAHLFTQTLGRSILRWREEQVVQFACHLLLVSPSPVKQIAAQVGFEDPLYFSRVFRKYMGTSPKAFRATHGYMSGDDA